MLCSIFGERDSLFHTRYKCLNTQKEETDNIVTYAGKVNALCELFKLKDLSVDMFKCYIFVQGLTAPRDKDLRSRILSIMEQDPEMNLQKVTEECQKVQVVKQKTFLKNKGKSFECWSCAGSHLRKNCPFKDQPCAKCGLVGHRASQCRTKQNKQRQKFKSKVNVVLSKEEVKQGGKRKFVNTKINGHTVKLLFDTNSDISIIDEVTWKRIGCPKLEKTSKIAKGVSGKRLKLKGEFNCSVSRGSKTFSSKVSVVPGLNSCLFGIDWIVLFDLWELPINSFCNCVSAGLSQAELMFARKIRSVFDRILPNTNKKQQQEKILRQGSTNLVTKYSSGTIGLGKAFGKRGLLWKELDTCYIL